MSLLCQLRIIWLSVADETTQNILCWIHGIEWKGKGYVAFDLKTWYYINSSKIIVSSINIYTATNKLLSALLRTIVIALQCLCKGRYFSGCYLTNLIWTRALTPLCSLPVDHLKYNKPVPVLGGVVKKGKTRNWPYHAWATTNHVML